MSMEPNLPSIANKIKQILHYTAVMLINQRDVSFWRGDREKIKGPSTVLERQIMKKINY